MDIHKLDLIHNNVKVFNEINLESLLGRTFIELESCPAKKRQATDGHPQIGSDSQQPE